MKKEIRISVVGNTATGKSTLMFEIYNLLLELGFDVELPPMSKENDDDYASQESFINQMLTCREERLDAVKAKTKITLREIQSYNVNQKEIIPEETDKDN
jgi:uridine kinase